MLLQKILCLSILYNGIYFSFSCLFINLSIFNYLKSFPVPAKAGHLGQSGGKWHGPSSMEILFLEYKWTMQGCKEHRRQRQGLTMFLSCLRFLDKSRRTPNKAVSAREGALALRAHSISQMWERELHLARGDQKPRRKYPASVKMDLNSNSLNNALDGKAKLLLHFLQVSFPCFHFLKESTQSELTLISLLGGRCILLTTGSLFQKGEQRGLEAVNYSYRAIQGKCMFFHR